MTIETSIGENYHFELRSALLIYQGRGTSFITRHEILQSETKAPSLGPAQPLTRNFIETLVRSIGGGARTEILPDNVLAKGDRMISWWTPPRRRPMFYKNPEGKATSLNGKSFPQPPLVWLVSDGVLRIRALYDNRRPMAGTTLAVAPFWNLSSDGAVCAGSMHAPESSSVPTWRNIQSCDFVQSISPRAIFCMSRLLSARPLSLYSDNIFGPR